MTHLILRASRRPILMAALAAAVSAVMGWAHADTYPNKPIRLVIPYAAGGPTDMIGRAVAHELEITLGQPVVVENRGGAGGIPGQTVVARAKADGYILLWGAAGTLAISPALYKSLPYDVLHDFTPIKLVASAPNAIVVNANVPVSNFPEFKEQAKKGTLTYASGGTGSAAHLAAQLAFADAQLTLLHVPFNGSAPALTGFRGKHTDVIVDVISTVVPLLDASQGIRAIAQTGDKRAEALSDVPTMRELGYDTVVSSWWGVLGPKGIPEDVVRVLSAATDAVLAKDSFKEILRKAGASPVGGSPASFGTFMQAETRKWASAVKSADIPVQ